MARLARLVIPGLPHHITQRGNRRQQTFFNDGDYSAYVELMSEWCREEGEAKCILFNLSGHGLCDMSSYDRYFSGQLEDYAYPQEHIESALAELPVLE